MNSVAKTTASLLIVAVSLFAEAQNPHVEWVRGTDFERFRTFTWASAAYAVQDPAANFGLARAVQSELEEKMVRFVEPQDKFDCFVTYNAKVNQDSRNSSQNVLTLNVRVFDSRDNSVVWSAGGYATFNGDKAQNYRNALELLHRMFQRYPPK